MPEYMSGVINLRGSVVPVVDLCKNLILETTRGVDTGIIVIEILQNREEADERF